VLFAGRDQGCVGGWREAGIGSKILASRSEVTTNAAAAVHCSPRSDRGSRARAVVRSGENNFGASQLLRQPTLSLTSAQRALGIFERSSNGCVRMAT
jgi:hypothetical protein